MQWVPFGGQGDDFKDAVRTFAAVFPEVVIVKGPGGYGAYMLGSSSPIRFDEADVRAVLGGPRVLQDISSAYDSPATTVDGWLAVIDRQVWSQGTKFEPTRDQVRSSPTIVRELSTFSSVGSSTTVFIDSAN